MMTSGGGGDNIKSDEIYSFEGELNLEEM